MKTNLSILIALLSISIGASATILPSKISAAMKEVHEQAKSAKVTNLNMLNYVYYKSEFCKQNTKPCTAEDIEKQLPIWQAKVGAAFESENLKYVDYQQELNILSTKYPGKDVTGFISATSYKEILQRNTFMTGLDYSKTVAGLALAKGFKAKDLRFFIMMLKSEFEKMCPSKDGQAAVMPRPRTQIMLAYKFRGTWHALNTQNANIEVVELGTMLPKRHELKFQLSLPAWLVNQDLILAGDYDARNFINGFQGQALVNITASGRMTSNSSDFICL